MNEGGRFRKLTDGSGDRLVGDVFPRDVYPPPGKGRAKRMGDIPTELLHNRMVGFGDAMDTLKTVFDATSTAAKARSSHRDL